MNLEKIGLNSIDWRCKSRINVPFLCFPQYYKEGGKYIQIYVFIKYILHETGGKISYLTTTYRVTLNIRFFLESVKREEKGGRWEEEEENIAKQSYHVLKPLFMKIKYYHFFVIY